MILLNYTNMERKKFFDQILLLIDLINNYKKINIMRRQNEDEIIQGNNILINGNNIEFIDKLFSFFYNQASYHCFVNEMNFIDLEADDEKLIQHLSFIDIGNLYIEGCNLNLNCLKHLSIQNLDLSKTSVTDIKGICEIATLSSLNLSNNPYISNLFLLKDAKFKKLKELHLSNNNLKDLYSIKMGEYKFDNLTILDLSHNEIEDLTPVQIAFESLKILNLQDNNIKRRVELSYIIQKNKLCRIMLEGNETSIWDFGTYIK